MKFFDEVKNLHHKQSEIPTLALGLGPLFMVALIKVGDYQFEQTVSFMVAYYWMALVLHPYIEDKVSHRRYRLSFIRLIYSIDKNIRKLLIKIISASFFELVAVLVGGLVPIAFCTSLYLFSGKGSIALAILGSYLFPLLKRLSANKVH